MSNLSGEKVVTIDPLSDDRWDKFVEKHPFGWLTHLSGWKKVLENSFKHMKGHYLAILNEDQIQAALPIYESRSWLTGNKLISIPFATLCDPLVSGKSDMKHLLAAVKRLATERRISCFEISTLNAHTLIEDDSLLLDNHYKHHYLLLDRPPEDLKKKFSRSCIRQRISRAEKSGLILKKVLDASGLNAFYQLHLKSRKHKGLPAHPHNFINKLWKEFSASQKITVFLAEYNNKPIAGIMLFKYKKRVSIEYAISDHRFLHLSPNHFIIWESIKSAYEEGFEILDFGRTSTTNVGLMNFKKHWGTEVVTIPKFFYPKATTIAAAQTEKLWKHKMMRGICKHSPGFLQETIGNICYHL